MTRCPPRPYYFRISSAFILHWHQDRCRKAASAIKIREGKSSPDIDRRFTCNHLPLRLDLLSELRNANDAQLMPSGSKEPGSTTDIDYSYEIAKIPTKISNSCGLSTTTKLICLLQLENSGTQLLCSKMKIVVEVVLSLSWKKHVSISRNSTKETEQRDSDARLFSMDFIQKDIKYVF